MTLPPGTRLNTYEIVGPLGAGGMGEVYRARDTKLDREVALKLVLEVFAGDRDRATRFEREAKALAALNHPNVATLYGLEHADGRHFLVMELVEGETLGDRIARNPGGLPLEDALQIARQIAEALEAAHEKGVVHRDLKPANVKITPDDKVKVLDFGLAKVAERDGGAGMSPSMSPTISAFGTQAGLIMGTASYMSPEQARGYTADHRSDVFAFGIVLYEMLTGRQPFPGETISDVLASVLARDPDLAALPSDLSPRLIDLVKRCLEKNPKRRWQAMGDVRYELETLMLNPRAVAAAPLQQIVHVERPLWRRVLPIAAAVLLTALSVAAGAWAVRPAPQALPVARFSAVPPDGKLLGATALAPVTISPDASRIAYVAQSQIYVRQVSQLDAIRVLPVEASEAIFNVAFSPDGLALVYSNGGVIWRVPSSGGQPVTVTTGTIVPWGITWEGESLLYASGRKVLRVSAGGGEPETLLELPEDRAAFRPQSLPDGKTILLTTFPSGEGVTRAGDGGTVIAQRLGESGHTILIDSVADARFVAPAHLLFARQGVLFAMAFDPVGMKVSGSPVPVVEGVRRSFNSAQFAVARAGALVYVPGPAQVADSRGQVSFVLADRAGGREFLNMPSGAYAEPRLSPDGRMIAYVSAEGTGTNIWVYDLKLAGAARRLTFGDTDVAPVWSADSTRITFQSRREEDAAIYWQRADGNGVAERLTKPEPEVAHVPRSWSPDGGVLLVDVVKGGATTVMAWRPRDKNMESFGGIQSSRPTGATFSPDGRWVAYSVRAATDSARSAVFIQPFPATGALFQISKSSEDARHPVWARDGRELLYNQGGPSDITVVPLTLSPAFAAAEAVKVPRRFVSHPANLPRPHDAAPDGKLLSLTGTARTDTLSAAAAPSAPVSEELRIVLNWLEELRAKVPIK